MDEKRRAEIRDIVEHFRGKPVNQNVLREYCNKKHYEPIVLGDLEDYTAQVKHDEIVVVLFPKIMAELQKLKYVPEFGTPGERKKIGAENDEVRVNIVKLLEDHAIEYQYVSALTEELGNFVGGKIAMAGTTAFNKAIEVMQHVAREKFGGNLNMKHVADYAVSVFKKAFDKTGEEGHDKGNEEAKADPQ